MAVVWFGWIVHGKPKKASFIIPGIYLLCMRGNDNRVNKYLKIQCINARNIVKI